MCHASRDLQPCQAFAQASASSSSLYVHSPQLPSSTISTPTRYYVLSHIIIMGLAYNVYLNSDRIFGCKNCKAHLATFEAIISRVSSFHSSMKLPSSMSSNMALT